MKWRDNPATVRPMLATLADPPLIGAGLVYEPKYDGIRALVHVPPAGESDAVRIWSRLGNDKTTQFPSIVRALDRLRARLRAPLLIDAEIVALDDKGRPAGFQRLQGRIHLKESRDVEQIDKAQPVAIIGFDLLRDGADDIRGLPLTERRARLSERIGRNISGTLRISEQAAGDGHALHERALREGWEGLIVKEARAPYQSGRRSPAWRKLKVLQEQEFVIGGWTEPRHTRSRFGALLLGVYDDETGALVYTGHTGTGFNQAELERVWTLLVPREIPTSPFSEKIKSNEPAHWVKPDLVAQVRFTEWTADGKLRHPVYLGLRDDKRPQEVRRERKVAEEAAAPEMKTSRARTPARRSIAHAAKRSAPADDPSAASVVTQLRTLEDARRDGTIELRTLGMAQAAVWSFSKTLTAGLSKDRRNHPGMSASCSASSRL